MSKDEKSHRSGRDDSGGELLKQVYHATSELSTVGDLLAGLFIMLQSPSLDSNDQSLGWAWLEKVLRRYVDLKHGAHHNE